MFLPSGQGVSLSAPRHRLERLIALWLEPNVGLGYGRMLLIGDEDVFGAEVNAASKPGEDTAKAGDTVVTDSFRQNLQKPPDNLEFEKLDLVPSGAAGAYAVRYWQP